MAGVEASIIIPVFNQWELTRACLKSLAATMQDEAVEVIVVDNASTDVTPRACPVLGETLFGSAFRYHHCPTNINFGPASNIGAELATGQFLVFLNNDTVTLPGWYRPLLDDFSTYPTIAATGPVLLYPEHAFFGYTVQHLGVYVSPFWTLGHLYEGIPADSPLAQKRRFFQAITAACMVIRRTIFFEIGKFDERFINGFEDVDLCARLHHAGYQLTVNPQSRVVHHTSQTVGRHAHEEANSLLLRQTSLHLLVPDWHQHLQRDKLCLGVGTWQGLQATLPSEVQNRLDPLASRLPRKDLATMLLTHPFWKMGWHTLIDSSESEHERAVLRQIFFKLHSDPQTALDACVAALDVGHIREAQQWFTMLTYFCMTLESFVDKARHNRKRCSENNFPDIAQSYMEWLSRARQFEAEQLCPLMQAVWRLAQRPEIVRPSQSGWLSNIIKQLKYSTPVQTTLPLNYYCPVCAQKHAAYVPLPDALTSTFVQYGFDAAGLQMEFLNREKIICPCCGAMDRERLCAEYLVRRLGEGFTNPEFRFMEFAPTLAFSNFLRSRFTLRHETADLLRPGVDHILDLTAMPEIQTASVDAWVCLHMLEHIPNDAAALQELFRILKPHGFGLLMVPISLALEKTDENPTASVPERWRRFGQDDHIRLYAKEDFLNRVTAAGFHIQQLGRDYFGADCFSQLGLPDTGVLYLVEKNLAS